MVKAFRFNSIGPTRQFALCLFAALSATAVSAAPAKSAHPTFDATVQPLLKQSCTMCHSEKMASGGLNIKPFLDSTSLGVHRDGWERIVSKLRTGEMPPKGMPKPPAPALKALIDYVEAEFEKADRAAKPNPGRVTARRLNRAEYSNSVRDLLNIHFKATEEFPADDSSFGFDNIGESLTVSPALMQKYMIAAERIASRVVGADPLPKPGVFNKKKIIRRKGPSEIEFTDSVEFDADYDIRALIEGHRGAQGKPVTLVISVDGKPVKTVEVPAALTLVNRQGGGTQRHNETVRVHLSEGLHTINAAFPNDDFPKDLPPRAQRNASRNIFPASIEIVGPFPSKEPRVPNKVLVCAPSTGEACVEKILTPLVRRAYRRPVTKAEVAEIMSINRKALASGYNADQSLQFALSALLVSPKFLFRVERDPEPGKVRRISDIELASRLSYFLWSSMPDDELLTLATKNKLHTKPVLDAQLKRMLADPKSSGFAENFVGQWLETRSLDAAEPDEMKFPEWNTDLKEAMRTETRMYFEAMLRENRPISEFIDSNYTFLNDLLARHYGIEGVTGSDFRRVEVPVAQRGGVLTHGSVLTVSSYPSRTSVVLRGKYVLENLLGAPPPAPPPDIPAIDEAAVGKSVSLKQQMEQHRSDAACASCHSRMDPLGFGLENYDAIGRWRAEDGKFKVDASGTFPNGSTFSTPAEMRALLKNELPEFTRCLTEKMLIYSLGRGIERYDRRAIRDIVRQTEAGGNGLQTLVASVIHSLPFQARGGVAAGETKITKDPSVPKVSKESKATTKEVAQR